MDNGQMSLIVLSDSSASGAASVVKNSRRRADELGSWILMTGAPRVGRGRVRLTPVPSSRGALV